MFACVAGLSFANRAAVQAQSSVPPFPFGEPGGEPPPPSPFPPGQEPGFAQPGAESSQADNPQGEEPPDPAELQASFEPALSPYGEWADDPQLGRVWVPAPEVVGETFVPYASNGHWALTEYGWTWVSGWEWGWAPFHYGRWSHLGGVGPWCWVPGTAWSPGWVAWRSGGGYAGWAPLAPRNSMRDPATWRTSWVFVRQFDLGQTYPSYQPGMNAAELYRRTEPVRDTRVVTVGQRQLLVNPGPPPRGQVRAAPLAVVAPVMPAMVGPTRGNPVAGRVSAPFGPPMPGLMPGPRPGPAERIAPPPAARSAPPPLRGAPPPAAAPRMAAPPMPAPQRPPRR